MGPPSPGDGFEEAMRVQARFFLACAALSVLGLLAGAGMLLFGYIP